MPKPCSMEFREDVVRVRAQPRVRRPPAGVAAGFGIHPASPTE